MKILSKLDNTGMIEEVADKRYVTDAEKLTWNSKADKTYVDSQDALKADKTYVDSKVKTDVPAGAKFTETTINGKTGAIAKPDIVALGIPAQDTNTKPARFVIGTSTAGWTAADCDYLCDGTADQTEINAAITALPATGGEIVILDGTYNITAKINVTKDNVSIRGNGNATILKRTFDSSTGEGVITLTGRSGCKIANLQIDGNRASYTGDNNFGIYLEGSSNSTIKGNIANNNMAGIFLVGGSNSTITDNIANNNMAGIYLTGLSNSIIKGNIVNNNMEGIYLEGSSNSTIKGNVCNSNETGINLVSGSNNTLTGNTCNSNSTGLGLVFGSNNNTLTGNTCNSNSYGISLNGSGNTLAGITCNSNDYGIYVWSSDNSTITGNVYNSNDTGIYLEDSINNTITGNTCIRGTGLAADYTPSQHTIQLSSTNNNYNLISNNNCMGKAVTNEGGTGNTIIDNKWSNSPGRILENYSEKLVTLSGTSATINLLLGNVFVHTPSGNTTYTISNAVSGQAHSFTLIITQSETARTITFSASVRWQGGEIPDLTTASKTYILTFMTIDGGTTWLGMFGGEF